MKSIMLSIKPKYCELIANGKKTIEVRKSRPKAEPPFKVYIYCAKPSKSHQTICGCMVLNSDELYRHPKEGIKYGDSIELMCCNSKEYSKDNFLNGKVIGEFICDEISKFTAEFTDGQTYEDIRLCYFNECEEEEEMIIVSNEWKNPDISWICKESCLSFNDFRRYIGANFHDIPFYGWLISNLVIYDTPKELRTFNHPCIHEPYCVDCKYSLNEARFCYDESVGCDRHLRRPPQSWCYVEELGGENK